MEDSGKLLEAPDHEKGVSLFPHWKEHWQVRVVKIDGNELQLGTDRALHI